MIIVSRIIPVKVWWLINTANYYKDQRRRLSRLATVMFCGTPCNFFLKGRFSRYLKDIVYAKLSDVIFHNFSGSTQENWDGFLEKNFFDNRFLYEIDENFGWFLSFSHPQKRLYVLFACSN